MYVAWALRTCRSHFARLSGVRLLFWDKDDEGKNADFHAWFPTLGAAPPPEDPEALKRYVADGLRVTYDTAEGLYWTTVKSNW